MGIPATKFLKQIPAVDPEVNPPQHAHRAAPERACRAYEKKAHDKSFFAMHNLLPTFGLSWRSEVEFFLL